MIYEMIILVLPPILVLMYMMINHLQEQGKYYAFIFFVTVFPLMSLRRKIMAVKEPKELDPFLKQVAMITFVMSILVAIGLNYFFLNRRSEVRSLMLEIKNFDFCSVGTKCV